MSKSSAESLARRGRFHTGVLGRFEHVLETRGVSSGTRAAYKKAVLNLLEQLERTDYVKALLVYYIPTETPDKGVLHIHIVTRVLRRNTTPLVAEIARAIGAVRSESNGVSLEFTTHSGDVLSPGASYDMKLHRLHMKLRPPTPPAAGWIVQRA